MYPVHTPSHDPAHDVDASRGGLDGRVRLLAEKALQAWLVKTNTGVITGGISENLRFLKPESF